MTQCLSNSILNMSKLKSLLPQYLCSFLCVLYLSCYSYQGPTHPSKKPISHLWFHTPPHPHPSHLINRQAMSTSPKSFSSLITSVSSSGLNSLQTGFVLIESIYTATRVNCKGKHKIDPVPPSLSMALNHGQDQGQAPCLRSVRGPLWPGPAPTPFQARSSSLCYVHFEVQPPWAASL